jgi:uncharacterized protein (UPF0332 family)
MPTQTKQKENRLPSGLSKDKDVRLLAPKYLERATKNLELMNIISELSNNKEAQNALGLSNDYSNDEWIIITSYYAMYTSALALLAKIGYKSNVHTSTIWAIEKFFIERKILEPEYLSLLNHAKEQVSKNDVESLSKGKDNRETAQYNVTKGITHSIAEASMKNAYDFVNKARSIVLN